ncbi:peptidylprolyl isomerase [Alteromonas sp. ASW11-130]|uniref:peptidylprolyl isomerase n=1 Tax=Alteromonas sp. ASW11-130 TaxID=3015775 RepID=UPI0022420048|nr:peptidylprolyl isomerase [Alteromonas sp. ASW11-130]MCW8090683.1 peptidylprolyl isomerase [Alteromonas sp. ASW11-130]
MSKIMTLLISALLFTSAAAQSEAHWFTPEQSQLAYIHLPDGLVIVALTDSISPNHVKRFKQLAKSRFYDNQSFYRVIDGFVAQGGSNGAHELSDSTTPLKAEFTGTSAEGFYEIERPGLFAPVSGFINGFAAATTLQRNSYWLVDCPGMLAMARDNKKDTATTEFYVVIGQAPRHLDRNMSVFGRVVAGLDVLQKLPRSGYMNSNESASTNADNKIISIRMGDTLPSGAQRHFRIQLASHPDYLEKIKLARNLDNPFYVDRHLSPRPIDICYYQTQIEEL